MASATAVLRTCLTASGLNKIIRQRFDEVPDTRRAGSVQHSLVDAMMAAVAMFQFKSPSLLQFDSAARNTEDATLIGNLKRLFWLSEVPSDSRMREILDEVSPGSLRRAFRGMQSAVQRGRMLEDFKVFDDKLVVSIDETGLFSSTSIQALRQHAVVLLQQHCAFHVCRALGINATALKRWAADAHERDVEGDDTAGTMPFVALDAEPLPTRLGLGSAPTSVLTLELRRCLSAYSSSSAGRKSDIVAHW